MIFVPSILAVAIVIIAGSFSHWQNKHGLTFQRLRKFYRDTAVIVLNTVIFLLLVNALLFVAFWIKDSINNNKTTEIYLLGDDSRWVALEKVYPDSSRAEIKTLLNETYSPARAFLYEPFTEFKERPYAGKYVNVDRNGFRVSKNQGPWPPNREQSITIFLFGGSTAFGFGVPDNQTIASYLQEFLTSSGLKREVRVYNFGQGSYYSTQERILFEKLLVAGFRPEMAIFIDGLNDAHHYEDRPSSATRIEHALTGYPVAWSQIFVKVPMVRAALAVKQGLGVSGNGEAAHTEQERAQDEAACGNGTILQNVINRYVENKKIIETVAFAYGVKTLFVWQPVAVYKYDQRYNLFAGDYHQRKACVEGVYPRMAKFLQQHPLGVDFLWCADIQENKVEPLYVDPLHYSGKMSGILAKNIFDMIKAQNLLPINDH